MTATCNELAPVDVIPQRPPFRFIERILEGEPGRNAVASLYVRADNPVFGGHFPGRPVYPGVLMIEQMAQTACWVMAADATVARQYVLVRVNSCEFKRQAGPGDTLVSSATLTRQVGDFAFFDCRLSCGEQLLATAQLLVAQASPSDSQGTLS
jgi:3-hydroxyacyl-[acyl-carrier-protein] dehydratase